jgi:hypothetical protein
MVDPRELPEASLRVRKRLRKSDVWAIMATLTSGADRARAVAAGNPSLGTGSRELGRAEGYDVAVEMLDIMLRDLER